MDKYFEKLIEKLNTEEDQMMLRKRLCGLSYDQISKLTSDRDSISVRSRLNFIKRQLSDEDLSHRLRLIGLSHRNIPINPLLVGKKVAAMRQKYMSYREISSTLGYGYKRLRDCLELYLCDIGNSKLRKKIKGIKSVGMSKCNPEIQKKENKAFRLRNKGMTYAAIGKEIGLSGGAARSYVLRAAKRKSKKLISKENEREVREVSETMKKKIIQLRLEKAWSYGKIASELGLDEYFVGDYIRGYAVFAEDDLKWGLKNPRKALKRSKYLAFAKMREKGITYEKIASVKGVCPATARKYAIMGKALLEDKK